MGLLISQIQMQGEVRTAVDVEARDGARRSFKWCARRRKAMQESNGFLQTNEVIEALQLKQTHTRSVADAA